MTNTLAEMATTYNLPNYTGELFEATPANTPFLSAIGGLTGGKSVASPVFSWQGYDLRDANAENQKKEGADVDAYTEQKRFNVENVTEIHQEAISISYSRLGANRMRTVDSGEKMVQIGSTSVPASELAFQIDVALKNIARDVEKGFLNNTMVKPSDNSTARRSGGLLGVIKTNKVTTEKTAKTITEDDVLDLIQKVWDNGGMRESETATLIVNSTLKRALTCIFLKEANRVESSRNVGGVNLQTIETDFGKLNIMLNSYVSKTDLIVCSLEQCAPAFLEVPGKGHFFVEPLAKTGSAEKVQLYGEIGLEYGNEKAHGVLTVAS